MAGEDNEGGIVAKGGPRTSGGHVEEQYLEMDWAYSKKTRWQRSKDQTLTGILRAIERGGTLFKHGGVHVWQS